METIVWDYPDSEACQGVRINTEVRGLSLFVKISGR